MIGNSRQGKLFNKDYWFKENLKYVEPHYRLYKISHSIIKLSQGRNCDLLDIGCGPAALAKLLPININYFGIDMAIHDPAPNLMELDIINNKILFENKTFDFTIASGLFEYLGNCQKDKLSEIRNITKENGYFILSYVNFGHVKKNIIHHYSNVQSIDTIKRDIKSYFNVRKIYPTFYHLVGREPRRKIIQRIQKNLYFNLPIISSLFAVEFIFVCTPRR